MLSFAVFATSCDGPAAPEPVDPSLAPKPRQVAEEDYTVLPNGLKIYDFKEGEGSEAENGDEVWLHYHGWLTDSTLFDSSFLRDDPFGFFLGSGRSATGFGNVIEGWNIGVVGMKVGGERQLVIPPELGYGVDGRPPSIPPNATLIFELYMQLLNPD